MYNFMIALLATTSANPFMDMILPVKNLLDMALTPALMLVGSIGAIYCVILGAKLAKADEPQEHMKAKNALKNAIIGFALIFILIAALRVGIGPLTDWMETYQNSLDDTKTS